MRLMFFVPLPRAPLRTVLTAFDDKVLVSGEQGGVQYVKSPYGISVWRLIVSSIRDNMPASEAPSGKWAIWCVTCPGDQEQTKRLYRWLGRYRISEPDRVLGPYDIKRFKVLASTRQDDDGNALADLFCGVSVPWIIFGNDVAAVQEEEYDPSDTDMQED